MEQNKQPNILVDNNETVKGPIKVANKLNEIFIKKVQKIRKNMKDVDKDPIEN